MRLWLKHIWTDIKWIKDTWEAIRWASLIGGGFLTWYHSHTIGQKNEQIRQNTLAIKEYQAQPKIEHIQQDTAKNIRTKKLSVLKKYVLLPHNFKTSISWQN